MQMNPKDIFANKIFINVSWIDEKGRKEESLKHHL